MCNMYANMSGAIFTTLPCLDAMSSSFCSARAYEEASRTRKTREQQAQIATPMLMIIINLFIIMILMINDLFMMTTARYAMFHYSNKLNTQFNVTYMKHKQMNK